MMTQFSDAYMRHWGQWVKATRHTCSTLKSRYFSPNILRPERNGRHFADDIYKWKHLEFDFKFRLFLKVQLKMCRNGLVPNKQHTITCTDIDQDLWRHKAWIRVLCYIEHCSHRCSGVTDTRETVASVFNHDLAILILILEDPPIDDVTSSQWAQIFRIDTP